MKPIWFFAAVVELTSPGAVSRPGEAGSDTIDAQVERDPNGGFWVPGTSVAGSLRGHYQAHKDEQTVRRLLGWVEDKTREQLSGRSPTASASLIRVLGTRTVVPDNALSVTIQQTAIDRGRRAARNLTLRSGEFMPVGTRVRIDLVAEDEAARDSLRELLPSWRPVIGRSRSNGFGSTDLIQVRWGTLDRAGRAGLRQWLTTGGPDLVDQVATTDLPITKAVVEPTSVTVTASVVEALMIRSGKPETRPGEPMVTTTMKRGGKPYVPASTLRGFVRSRMEYILRSLGAPVCLDTGCGECWSCQTFGFGGLRGGGTVGEGTGRRGRVRFHDAQLKSYQLATRQRNSIDRFTGGAADQRLWSEEVVEHGRFEITIDALPLAKDTAAETAERWEEFRALLTLVWLDVHDGYHRLGGGVTTGHGRLALAGVDLEEETRRRAIATVRSIVDPSEIERAAS